LRLVSDINRTNYGGRSEVGCYTCHRSELRPAVIPSVSQVDPEKPAADRTAPMVITSVDRLFERYLQAMGGTDRLAEIRTRFAKGTMISSNRPPASIEIYGKSPNRFLVLNTFDASTLAREGFDGNVGWGGNAYVAHEIADQQLAKVKRDAEFFKAIRL